MAQEYPEDPTFSENEHLDILKPMTRGVPGDAALLAMVNRPPEQQLQSRRRSQFYGDVFAVREPTNTARERVTGDSVVAVEIKTNVIVSHRSLSA